MLEAVCIILFLSFTQNIAFAITSRSRNRGNMKYVALAATFSNSIWFMTFRYLVRADMTFFLFMPYVIGNVLGCLSGVKLAMRIERWLGASADGHLKEDCHHASK